LNPAPISSPNRGGGSLFPHQSWLVKVNPYSLMPMWRAIIANATKNLRASGYKSKTGQKGAVLICAA
jgi:hypothetical protein